MKGVRKMITYFILWILQDAMPTAEQTIRAIFLAVVISLALYAVAYGIRRIIRAIKLTKEGYRYGRKR